MSKRRPTGATPGRPCGCDGEALAGFVRTDRILGPERCQVVPANAGGRLQDSRSWGGPTSMDTGRMGGTPAPLPVSHVPIGLSPRELRDTSSCRLQCGLTRGYLFMETQPGSAFVVAPNAVKQGPAGAGGRPQGGRSRRVRVLTGTRARGRPAAIPGSTAASSVAGANNNGACRGVFWCCRGLRRTGRGISFAWRVSLSYTLRGFWLTTTAAELGV